MDLDDLQEHVLLQPIPCACDCGCARELLPEEAGLCGECAASDARRCSWPNCAGPAVYVHLNDATVSVALPGAAPEDAFRACARHLPELQRQLAAAIANALDARDAHRNRTNRAAASEDLGDGEDGG